MKRSTIVVACAALGLVFGAFGAPLARGAPAKGVVRHACLLQGMS
jgi:hypothetical protein